MSEALEDYVPDGAWPSNYFNYFTEIEEHFQRARGTGLFLMSPLDWALIENWKNSGVPLEAVLRGIDDAFAKWRSRKSKIRLINSVAYCAQAVAEAAERAPVKPVRVTSFEAPFSAEEIRAHLSKVAATLRQRTDWTFDEIAVSLEALASETEKYVSNLEELERRLTAMEDKMIATLRSAQTNTEIFALREALDRELKPYRSKMTADQLALLERRYLDTALLERSKLPRLSLFYLH